MASGIAASAARAVRALPKSFVSVPQSNPFPLANLPIGMFKPNPGNSPRACFRIGDKLLDVKAAVQAGLFKNLDRDIQKALQSNTLNAFMGLRPEAWTATRARVTELLDARTDTQTREVVASMLHDAPNANYSMPVQPPAYIDAYAGIEHAKNMGRMLRPGQPMLMPNYTQLPVMYAGSHDCVTVGGTALNPSQIRRPMGIVPARDNPEQVMLAPTARFDIESELALYMGGPTQSPVTLEEAEKRLFGLGMLNDWSARDLQAKEYVPLGPFNGKPNPEIGPLIMMRDALKAHLSMPMPEQDPAPPIHLQHGERQGINLSMLVSVTPPGSRTKELVMSSHARDLYWSADQLFTHALSNGRPLKPGTIIGTGTISSGSVETAEGRALTGSFSERTAMGKHPIPLKNGQSMTFLTDGTKVHMSANSILKDGQVFGLGEMTTQVMPVDEFWTSGAGKEVYKKSN